MKPTTVTLTLLAIAMVASGCGSDPATGPVFDTTAHWTVVVNRSAPTGAVIGDGDAQPQPMIDGRPPDSVTLSGGVLVIRSLRWTNDGNPADTNITAEDQNRDQNDNAIRFKGPYVVALGSTNNELATASVTSGAYNHVRFVLQPAQASDPGVTDDMVGHSIVAAGTVWRNGRPSRFTYVSDYTSEVVVEGAFEVPSGQTINCALVVEAGRWFRAGDGWLDPASSANRQTILNNIRRNITVRMGVEGVGTL
ncbi:MAG: hypothetical protein HY304_04405 [candidate division Zixibacteria bacterium]|nr:hypothetical protein [candidate division Zixibacteria bacterium]